MPIHSPPQVHKQCLSVSLPIDPSIHLSLGDVLQRRLQKSVAADGNALHPLSPHPYKEALTTVMTVLGDRLLRGN